LARSFRRTAAEGRTRVACGPFEAFLSETTDDYLMSVATPVADEADWDAAIASLDRLFAARSRRLRLEYFEALHPGLQGALERVGLRVERRDPVMALPRARWAAGGAWGRLLTADDLDGIAALEAVQCAAYGEDLTREAQAAYRPILLEGLRSGAMVAVLIEDEGRLVAAAQMLGGIDASELAGVATVPDARRRGYGAQACRGAFGRLFRRRRRIGLAVGGRDGGRPLSPVGLRDGRNPAQYRPRYVTPPS
jgi:hypothetical protein